MGACAAADKCTRLPMSLLAETSRTPSVDLGEGDFAEKFDREADDLPPSAYTFGLLGTVCKTVCCGGRTSAYGRSWKL